MKAWRVPYPKFGRGQGLERVARIAAALDINLDAFGASAAVIVGSNGKGSTAAMTASLLQQSERSVGLFTSPHMMTLNERFRVDGEDISDTELDLCWRRVAAAAEAAGEARNLGGFEFLFLIAADWFRARGCAFTVWEAGIGGRLDPVRLIASRQLALTALDLEHTHLLGSTLAEIAAQKIDAAPDGATLFVAESCNSERAAIEAHCLVRDIRPVFVSALSQAPLAGVHQAENAALADALARTLIALTSEQVAAGLAGVRWPGRLEIIERTPLIIIDVGHTPAAVRRALEGFRVLCGGRQSFLVCGVSADKDVAAIVDTLAAAFRVIVCAHARHKGAPAAEIAARAGRAHPEAEIIVAESVADAHRIALRHARPDDAIYVAGGLFLAAEFKASHRGLDPASLAFF